MSIYNHLNINALKHDKRYLGQLKGLLAAMGLTFLHCEKGKIYIPQG